MPSKPQAKAAPARPARKKAVKNDKTKAKAAPARPVREKAVTTVKTKAKAKGVVIAENSLLPDGAGSRTPWFEVFAGSKNAEYIKYMRDEWGWEKRGEDALFEKLCLEGQQAGLSWATVLAKRGAYRRAFHGFSVDKCAKMTEKDVDRVLSLARAGPGGHEAVICHRGKLLSIACNARCVLALRSTPYVDGKTGQECRDLDALLWSFVGGRPQLNKWAESSDIPAVTPTAESMSKVLKKLGFRFVGATICYSLMQSCGLVIDHPMGTPEHRAAARRLRNSR